MKREAVFGVQISQVRIGPPICGDTFRREAPVVDVLVSKRFLAAGTPEKSWSTTSNPASS
jgi:hypothetical protein